MMVLVRFRNHGDNVNLVHTSLSRREGVSIERLCVADTQSAYPESRRISTVSLPVPLRTKTPQGCCLRAHLEQPLAKLHREGGEAALRRRVGGENDSFGHLTGSFRSVLAGENSAGPFAAAAVMVRGSNRRADRIAREAQPVQAAQSERGP